ncbi:hypothetical protein L7F22_014821 [Adiantum nelumboides]|nr:hypothetical protein [Adiantum nelumboides]
MAGTMQQLQTIAATAVVEESNLSWKEFFKDPANWSDNCNSTRSPRQPDFKHKVTKEPLWMDSPAGVHNGLIRKSALEEMSAYIFGASKA